LDEFRSNKSFTTIGRASFNDASITASDPLVFLTVGPSTQVFQSPLLCFSMKFGYSVTKYSKSPILLPDMRIFDSKNSTYLSMGKTDSDTGFVIAVGIPTPDIQIALVQDVSASKWIAYIGFYNDSGITKYRQELAIPDGFTWSDVDQPVSFSLAAEDYNGNSYNDNLRTDGSTRPQQTVNLAAPNG
jgi:hypothetical protein